MKRVGIAAVAAAGLLLGAAPVAQADGPIVGPCATVAELFETAKVHMEPLPEPLGSTTGTAVRKVCRVTG
jgi:hypothetical protein